MTTLILATRNTHKAAEISSILGDGFLCRTLRDFPLAPEITEDADSFAGNATKKAEELATWIVQTNKDLAVAPLDPNGGSTQGAVFVLADDSGLEVDALNGAPGVHSARFAALDTESAGNSKDSDNNAKLLRLLKDIPLDHRQARFRCVLALACLPTQGPTGSNDQTRLFDGVCEGRIGIQARGENGFGYDPLFIPAGFETTFAELGESTKNSISHRSAALAKLRSFFIG